MPNQKLELTWIGKEKRPKLEARILLEDAEKSYHAKVRSENAQFDNRLIFGDNLLALKALEQEFSGKVKCVFIDPPYNTGSAFTHYDDGLEHSIWLSLMRDRLEIIKQLLSDDGSLWITIDDNEAHYLKVLCDEIFGRGNFVGTIVWQHSIQGKNDAKLLSLHHNYILVYRNSDLFVRKLLPRTEEHNTNYKNPDNDPRGAWRSGDVRSPNYRENLRYVVKTPSGKEIQPPPNGWRWSEETFKEKVKTGEISFLDDETRVLRKIYLVDQVGRVPESIWFGKEAGTTRDASNHLASIIEDISFDTPKPEQLIERVLQIATNPGDLVLDSFAGSGTTGAVAHKMGRRWIMVELGEHCHTHIIPRLQKVIDGTDQGGISKAVNWQGGGGFRYYRLAPTLIVNDHWGNPVINPEYNPEMLAAALAKLEGFTYQPSETLWWQHGFSSERDFIYVTTQNLSPEQLHVLSDEVGKNSLLICCSAWRGISAEQAAERWPNLSLKKIPKMVLNRCEWGHDDYSLNVANLPLAQAVIESENQNQSKDKLPEKQIGLFDE
ncbi:site-specific DNA-methyltransferase [Treponema phagedenis]|uniref:site-specific DNA-methyltransferase (adenine-specific) n=1 Tax=Treponema phagedenis TaxID=162 RepID=A0AAE6IUC4_TREPH|nr:site-specific DNA-methyltransferase [Treponema phagedenis]NVP22884.1 site-specific DNA-methyltransferase [Treponema phagedenis]QEJ94958.1 site-specific DNA-methyltransferase [Treponema phagedenis]QEJ98313.1 site-specific DNA-methyltransferase [Treponema phagedenis]QEK00861.1 site-specific DNA-methyltransferase [Treponema phagedenis]QEK03823.1 site-specific DNA-methyltransferase [Treponema phagedenis]